jgi:hypothetical protein
MDGERSRYGLLVSALGAIVLAISVYLPWYGLSFTASGVALVQRLGDQVASQFGNAALQGYMAGLHANLSALTGQQFIALSAHQALKDLSVILLILAGLALLDSLIPLARSSAPMPAGSGAAVVLLGCLTTICVLFRMVDPPVPAGEYIAMSLRPGAWLALLGSLAMVAGGLWPRGLGSTEVSEPLASSTWSGLSGWTPEG